MEPQYLLPFLIFNTTPFYHEITILSPIYIPVFADYQQLLRRARHSGQEVSVCRMRCCWHHNITGH